MAQNRERALTTKIFWKDIRPSGDTPRDSGPSFQDTFIRETRVSYVFSSKCCFEVRSAIDIVEFVRSVLTDNSREHFVALYLDARRQVVAYSILSIGTANATLVAPREVFQRAILAGAVSIAVAHNHPSGCSQISRLDRQVTHTLRQAGELLGIELIDHVIVTDHEWTSIRHKDCWNIWPVRIARKGQWTVALSSSKRNTRCNGY